MIERQDESLPSPFARLTDELTQLVHAKLELLKGAQFHSVKCKKVKITWRLAYEEIPESWDVLILSSRIPWLAQAV